MATYEDLKISHRIFMRQYPFARFAVLDNPKRELSKPLDEAKFALVTSGGLRLADDAPFDRKNKFGDVSFREIPNEADVQTLIEDHKSSAFDHAGIERDKNLALPLERFRQLLGEKKIGALNRRHFSLMGSIINPRPLIEKTAPQIAELLKNDRVDCVFLTPV